MPAANRGHETKATPRERDAGEQRYVKTAMAQPLLSREEENALARRWSEERDEKALHKLTEAHLRDGFEAGNADKIFESTNAVK